MKKNINKKKSTSDGIVIVYTGEGKGKTSAALGLICRAAGWEKKIAVFQFIKGYKNIGEWKFFQNQKNISFFQSINTKTPFVSKPEKKHEYSCKKLLNQVREVIEKNLYDIIILDEINNAIFYHLVEVGEVIEIVRGRPQKMTVVLTGRNAKPEIIALADLVSEIKKIKHPYDDGIPAKKGIDF